MLGLAGAVGKAPTPLYTVQVDVPSASTTSAGPVPAVSCGACLSLFLAYFSLGSSTDPGGVSPKVTEAALQVRARVQPRRPAQSMAGAPGLCRPALHTALMHGAAAMRGAHARVCAQAMGLLFTARPELMWEVSGCLALLEAQLQPGEHAMLERAALSARDRWHGLLVAGLLPHVRPLLTSVYVHTAPPAASPVAHKARVLQNLIDLLKAEEEGLVVRQKQVGGAHLMLVPPCPPSLCPARPVSLHLPTGGRGIPCAATPACHCSPAARPFSCCHHPPRGACFQRQRGQP